MLGLTPRLIANLETLGITEPTPIQKQAIPHAMNGRDVMGLAQTGTGKTLAFGLPLLTELQRYEGRPAPKTVRGLILAPTRELAKQISENLKSYADGTSVRVNLVVGGVSLNPQINRLQRGVDLLVATPGRLLDLLDRKALQLDQTRFLVLDEADQMLDLGFIHALRKIAALLSPERQTMLFSATMPKQMNEIANTYLDNPVRIETAPPGKPADKVDQSIQFVAQAEKSNLLIELLDKHRDELALVFTRTKPRPPNVCARRWIAPGLLQAPYTATNPKVSVNGRWRPSKPKTCAYWSPPMWPRGGSTFRRYAMSTTSTCPMCLTTMCIGSAALRAPDATVRRSLSVPLPR